MSGSMATSGPSIRELLGGPAFTPLREREGREAIDRMVEERVEILEGEVGEDVPELPPDLDVVLHAAASVSFDAPIDDAFRSNVLGARALYEAVRSSGASPHVLHVSTAYVAGVRRGTIAEEPLDHAVDWRVETDTALQARPQGEAAS